MYLKSFCSLALAIIVNGTLINAAGAAENQISAVPGETKAYFLRIDGRGLPLKQALVNGVNVLGGAVISLSLPVNISGYTKAGLNTVQLEYISDPKSNLMATIEKRTPGPHIEDLAKIEAAAEDSKEQKSKSVSFNLPADGGAASVSELSDSDKTAISNEFERYYQALSSARADQVRALYKTSLNEERKLSPESARFFDNVLTREVSILKNKDLKMNALSKDGLAFKVEGDLVKLYRQDSKPLIESNEVDARIDPLMIEVGPEQTKSKSNQSRTDKNKSDRAKVKNKIDKSQAETVSSTKAIEIPTTAFKPASEQPEKLIEEITPNNSDTITATEIPIGDATEAPLFDGSKAASLANKGDQSINPESSRPVRTTVRERLVRFNLYFKPSKPDSAGKRSWIVSLPPNV